MPQLPYKTYSSLNVTVPNDSANHQLLALMKAKDPNISPRAKYFVIQNDEGSADKVLVGEASTDDQGVSNPVALSSSNYGLKLDAGASETFGGWHQEDFSVPRLWVRTTGAGTAQLNVQIHNG